MLCAIAMLGLLQHGFAQTNNGKPFTIKGTLTGAHADSVTLHYEAGAGNYMHTTNPVVNNEFTITGSISHPVSARIIFKKTGEVIPRRQQENRMREFYIEPTAMTITGDPVDIKTLTMTGSKTQAEYDGLNSKIELIRQEEKPLDATYDKANEAYMNAEKNKKTKSVLDSLKNIAADLHDKFDPYNDRIKKVTYQFFLDHPNSYITLDMMRYYVSSMSLDSTKQVCNAFNDELKATPEAKKLTEGIKRVEFIMQISGYIFQGI